MIEADTNNEPDVYVRDLSKGMTERVSIGLDGDDPNAMSYFPSLSADGRYVAFASMASNLVAGDTNDMADVFIYDRVTNRTERVSVSSAGEQSEDGGFEVLGPSISADLLRLRDRHEVRRRAAAVDDLVRDPLVVEAEVARRRVERRVQDRVLDDDLRTGHGGPQGRYRPNVTRAILVRGAPAERRPVRRRSSR